MPALIQISINFSAIHPLPKYSVSTKKLGLYKLKFLQPINNCSVSRLKFKSFYKDSFRADASRTKLQFLGVGRGKDGIPVSRGRRVVLAKFNIGSGGGGGGGDGGGRVNGETARVVGNLALAILLTYLSMTRQLGWLLDGIVSLWKMSMLLSSSAPTTTSSYPTPAFRLTRAAVAFPGATIPVRSRSRPLSVSLHCDDQPFVPEVEKAVDSLYSEFRAVDNLVARNSARVLKAFQNVRVGSHHFGGSTGYGHEESGGREALDQAFAEIFGAESAIVRAQFFSGTHAITCALFAFLRPGDELLAVAGAPYDTLEEVIGVRDSNGLGSLKDFGIDYREVPLAADGGLDWEALKIALKPQTKCALIQRSCGYSWRRSLSVDEIGRAIEIIKLQNPHCLVMVDNCYGEFTETIEPPMVGADLIAGSFIKNPGGTIAPCGGYVAGRKKWVAAAAARLSAPGLGIDCGSTPGDIMRIFFQGLFLAPQMVGEAIKGSLLIAEVMEGRGYQVQPGCRVPRHDVVQAVKLGSRERLLAFCEAVQKSSPVSSFTKPIAGATPGYASEVIFADGTFIDGSTSELSCDGPLREPFAVFCQGGSHWTQWGLVLGEVLKSL